MKNKKLLRHFLLLIFGYILYPVYSQDASSIYQKVVKSTVTISTDKGSGSGFFIGDHLIVTCYHVVEGSNFVDFFMNSSDRRYHIDGYFQANKEADLILLYSKDFTAPPLNISKSNYQIGQKVFTIGSPRGMNFSISDGIISGLREKDGIELLQITAPLSHGNSGGPVLNQNGDLIGVSASIIREAQNLNFAIPKLYVERLLNSPKHSLKPIVNLQSNNHSIKKGWLESIDDFNYDEAFLNALIAFAFPVVIDNAGTSLKIDYRGETPEYGEYCYFFAVDLDNPRLLAYGTVSGINQRTCSVDVLESVSEFNQHTQFLILFAHELE